MAVAGSGCTLDTTGCSEAAGEGVGDTGAGSGVAWGSAGFSCAACFIDFMRSEKLCPSLGAGFAGSGLGIGGFSCTGAGVGVGVGAGVVTGVCAGLTSVVFGAGSGAFSGSSRVPSFMAFIRSAKLNSFFGSSGFGAGSEDGVSFTCFNRSAKLTGSVDSGSSSGSGSGGFSTGGSVVSTIWEDMSAGTSASSSSASNSAPQLGHLSTVTSIMALHMGHSNTSSISNSTPQWGHALASAGTAPLHSGHSKASSTGSAGSIASSSATFRRSVRWPLPSAIR